MDATVHDTPVVEPPISRGARIALLGVVLAAVLIELFDRASLVDPLPLPVTVASAGIGLAAGSWLSLRMSFPAYVGAFRRTLARIGAPIFGAVLGTFFARVVIEAAVFAGLNPPAKAVVARVDSASPERAGGQFAEVSFGPGTRSVYVEISPDLYDQLDPVRAPGRDCIVLGVETGRLGFRRTKLPRRFLDDPIGKDRYRRCGR